MAASSASRIALGVQYDGRRYRGWQVQAQPAVDTIQHRLELALAAVAGAPVRVRCAGRTDAGVHATGQVVHFDPVVSRPLKAWVLGGNAHLPDDIAIQWALPVADDFHARFSALARCYRYLVYDAPVRPALFTGLVTWQRQPLDASVMHSEAQVLLGEQDFSSFRAAGCQSNTPWRCVHSVTVHRRGRLVILEIKANAFLHHMVRNIAGTLLAVGSGRAAPGWTGEVLRARDRTLAAPTAPPDGLYLVEVEYPAEFQLPRDGNGIALLDG